jgi:hypothetical protein
MAKLWEAPRSSFSNQMATCVLARMASALAGTRREAADARCSRPRLEATR